MESTLKVKTLDLLTSIDLRFFYVINQPLTVALIRHLRELGVLSLAKICEKQFDVGSIM